MLCYVAQRQSDDYRTTWSRCAQAELGQDAMLQATLAVVLGFGWGGTAAVVATHHEAHTC